MLYDFRRELRPRIAPYEAWITEDQEYVQEFHGHALSVFGPQWLNEYELAGPVHHEQKVLVTRGEFSPYVLSVHFQHLPRL